MTSIGRIADAIPADVDLTVAERDGVLEIALLAISADRSIHEDELVALRRIALKLGGRRLADEAEAAVDALVAKGLASREDADARLHALAETVLTRPEVRKLAYRAAYALALADLSSADEEFEFDLQLIDALGLSQSEADAITEEVVAALDPGDRSERPSGTDVHFEK